MHFTNSSPRLRIDNLPFIDPSIKCDTINHKPDRIESREDKF